VWGSPSSGYTVDSRLADVAIHAGLLARGATGFVKVTPLGQLASFTGSNANGINTLSYSSFCGMSVALGTPTAPAEPSISVLHTPTPMVAGQKFSLIYTTANATRVALNCTASGSGFVRSYDDLPVNSSDTMTASLDWVGFPSTCTWTAIGPGGTKSHTETWTTVISNAPPPTIEVSYSSSPLIADKPFTLTWKTTNATSLTRVCTAQGTGFTSSVLPSNAMNGSLENTASSAWVNYPSTCVWTATGWGGTKTLTEIRTTVATPPISGPPTLNVVHTPSPMVAGQNFTTTWSSTNATKVALKCTASGTGFVWDSEMSGTNSSLTTGAPVAWVGFPSQCTWTATGPLGTKSFSETWHTVAPTEMNGPSLEVNYTNMPLLVNQNFTLTWKSTNASSVTRQCTANGTGFTSPLQTMYAVNGSINSSASSAWIGYPSTCIWTATGPKGSKTVTEVRTTLAEILPAPSITVQYSPATLIAGQPFTATWSSSNASSVTYDCKSNGIGFKETVAANGSFSKVADAAWINTPLVCDWQAIGAGGNKSRQDSLTTQAPPEVITYFVNDVAGSPLIASDTSGNVVWKENYLPYGGKVANQAASKDNSISFAGSGFDQATGLSYMGARYYDPALGRFMGMDPVGVDIGNLHSVNRYAYANNNPYSYIDPTGRQAQGMDDIGSFSSATSTFSPAAKTGFVLGAIAGGVAAGGCDIYSGGGCIAFNGAMVAGGAALGASIGTGVDRAWKQLDNLMTKAVTSTGPLEYQYALVAKVTGPYPDVRGGLAMLKAGDVWKYGTTNDPKARYSAIALNSLGLDIIVQSQGNHMQVLVAEKIQLIDYAITHGSLPPGNRIFK